MNSEARARWRKGVDSASIVLFLIAIFAPLYAQFARPVEFRGVEMHEHRHAAPKPEFEWSLSALSVFPEQYDAWYGDNFGLREKLIRGHSLEYRFGFRVSPRPEVLLGKDGWMFYTGGLSMEVHRGLMPLQPQELEAWRLGLESQRSQLAEEGIDYLFVIAPNKESIYEQFLPDSQNRVGPSRMDQLMDFMRENSDVAMLDLRPALREEAKNDRPDDNVYFKLGSHWYGRGALVAQREIVQHLSRRFPKLAPLPMSKLHQVDGAADSWAQSAYIEDILPQGSLCYAPAEPRARASGDRAWGTQHTLRTDVDDPGLPRALLLEDSMGAYLEDLLAENFSHMATAWSHSFDLSMVVTEKPEVVIVVYVERVLLEPPPPVQKAQARSLDEIWRRSHDVRITLDAAQDPTPIVAEGEARIAKVETENGPAVGIVTRSLADAAILPAFDFPPQGEAIAFLDIDSPTATQLDLWYKPAGAKDYRRKDNLNQALEPGRNKLFFRLDRRDIDGRIRLRPGLAPGTYVIHAYEVRAVEKP